mgnify:CR=1 FL=1
MERNTFERDFIFIKSFLEKFKLIKLLLSSLIISGLIILSSFLTLNPPYIYEISFIKDDGSSLDFNIGKALPILSGGSDNFSFKQIVSVMSSNKFLDKVYQKIDIDYFMKIYGSDKVVDKSAFFKSWFLQNGPSVRDDEQTILIYYRNEDKKFCKSATEASFSALKEINESYSVESKQRLFKYLERKIDSLENDLGHLIKKYNKNLENNSNMPLSEYKSNTQSSFIQITVSQELLQSLYSVLPTMDPELSKSGDFFRLSGPNVEADKDQLFFLKHYIFIFIFSVFISTFLIWKKNQYLDLYDQLKKIVK